MQPHPAPTDNALQKITLTLKTPTNKRIHILLHLWEPYLKAFSQQLEETVTEKDTAWNLSRSYSIVSL